MSASAQAALVGFGENALVGDFFISTQPFCAVCCGDEFAKCSGGCWMVFVFFSGVRGVAKSIRCAPTVPSRQVRTNSANVKFRCAGVPR